jgi:hypothetical protein
MPNRKTIRRNRPRQLRRSESPYEQSHTLRKLQTLNERIRLCWRLASECAGKAKTAANNECRDDYLRIEKSWINLARSYEFAAQLLNKRDAIVADQFETGAIPSSRLH